jgi:Right handed beta helix region
MGQVAAVPALLTPDVATRVVSADGNGQYREIGEALREAPEGARIRVLPGVYRERLVLDKSVKIVGDGPADQIVVESDSAECLLSTASAAVVRGLTLRCTAGRKGLRVFAVFIDRGCLSLEDCDISSDSAAPCVAVHSKADPILRYCRIRHEGQCAVVVSQARGIFEACEITTMEVRDAGDPIVRQCRISGGISVFKGGRGTFEDCDISGGVRSEGEPAVRRCDIHDGPVAGVFVSERGGGTFEDCRIFDNGLCAVAAMEGSNPIVRRCKIFDGPIRATREIFEDCLIIDDCG